MVEDKKWFYWQNNSIEDQVQVIDGIGYVEKWEDIPDYDGIYKISTFGRIKGIKDGHVFIKKQRATPKGYIIFDLRNKGKKRTFYTHRAVAKSFIPNIENKKEVNHIKGDKNDNFYISLNWMTPKENSQHAYDAGLNAAQYGEINGKAKITNSIALLIFNSQESYATLSRMYSVSESTISSIKQGYTWGKVTGRKIKRIYLTEDQVIEIYKSPLSNTELTGKYKMSMAAISKIKSGYSWKEITSKII